MGPNADSGLTSSGPRLQAVRPAAISDDGKNAAFESGAATPTRSLYGPQRKIQANAKDSVAATAEIELIPPFNHEPQA